VAITFLWQQFKAQIEREREREREAWGGLGDGYRLWGMDLGHRKWWMSIKFIGVIFWASNYWIRGITNWEQASKTEAFLRKRETSLQFERQYKTHQDRSTKNHQFLFITEAPMAHGRISPKTSEASTSYPNKINDNDTQKNKKNNKNDDDDDDDVMKCEFLCTIKLRSRGSIWLTTLSETELNSRDYSMALARTSGFIKPKPNGVIGNRKGEP